MKKLHFTILAMVAFLLATGTNLFAQHNYAEVLQKSLFFYEAQQAGPLSPNNRVSWRANAVMDDGSDNSVDLSKGWFDAGDHAKFNFPMAYSVTTLCWGFLENKSAYESANQVEIFLENIKHATDYLINCHTAPNELWAQVADGDVDHKYWVPAEVVHLHYDRTSYKIDATMPGSDLAGECAAALAAASIVFKDYDANYSSSLLEHAKQLYTFADTYRGVYSDTVPANPFYTSVSGYQDELCWGAIWLYKATNDASFLTKARNEYDLLSNEDQTEVKSYGWTIAWDDKSYGCYVLMSALTGEAQYKEDAERHLNQWFTESNDGKGPKFTKSGFPWLTGWGSFRYAANTAFLLLEHSDNITDATLQAKYRERAKQIVDYLLGDNPQDISYVIGYGDKYPQKPHHRTAHASWERNEDNPVETRHILYGALVGGHKSANDNDWVDDRSDYQWNEVACDYNSLFQGAIARLYADHGGNIVPDFPKLETPNGEFLVEAKINASGDRFTEYAVWVHNRTAWPARLLDFKFRIFVDLSEGMDAGLSVSDYIIKKNGNAVTYSDLTAWDKDKNIYYTEITFNKDEVIFPGGRGESKREAQIRISVPNGSGSAAWDASNDPSHKGMTSSLSSTEQMPLYDANTNEKLFGDEPGPIVVIPPTGVEIVPATLTINKGQTKTLTATVSPENATNKKVTWKSDDESIATVNNDGEVTAVKKGNVKITATTVEGGITAECAVEVTDIVLPKYALTINTNEQGTVSLSPNATEYEEGTEVTLTAKAASGYQFVEWSGDITGSTNPITITMTGNKTVTPLFEVYTGPCSNPTAISLPFEKKGVGEFCYTTSGTLTLVHTHNADKVEINGVDVTNEYLETFPDKVDGKYQIYFKGSVNWANLTIEGTDAVTKEYTLTTNTVGQGSVEPNGGTYIEGAVVELKATPETGWKFVSWSGDASGTSQTTSVTMNSDLSVTANFEEISSTKYTLTTAKTGEGTVAVDPVGGTYAEGTVVSLTATPERGWKFVNWSGDVSGTGTSISVTMDANKAVTALFEETTTGECDFGIPGAPALSAIETEFENAFIVGSGPDLDKFQKLSIKYGGRSGQVWVFSINVNQSPWYISLKDAQTNTFHLSDPMITIKDSGIDGMDGEYNVNLKDGNFIMAEKSGAFTLIFSNSTTSPCPEAVLVKSTSSIETNGFNEISAYPNPVNELLTIEGLYNMQSVAIYSVLGQQIVNQQLNGENLAKFDVSNFERGTYYLKIENKKGEYNTKLLLID